MRHDIYSGRLLEGYYHAGDIEKANLLFEEIFTQVDKELNYYYSLRPGLGQTISLEKRISLQLLSILTNLTEKYKQDELHARANDAFERFYNQFIGEMPGQ